MDEEVRDGKVFLEVPRKAATLDFGVLRKVETAPSGAYWTRTTRNLARRLRWDVYWPGAGKPKGKFQLTPDQLVIDSVHSPRTSGI